MFFRSVSKKWIVTLVYFTKVNQYTRLRTRWGEHDAYNWVFWISPLCSLKKTAWKDECEGCQRQTELREGLRSAFKNHRSLISVIKPRIIKGLEMTQEAVCVVRYKRLKTKEIFLHSIFFRHMFLVNNAWKCLHIRSDTHLPQRDNFFSLTDQWEEVYPTDFTTAKPWQKFIVCVWGFFFGGGWLYFKWTVKKVKQLKKITCLTKNKSYSHSQISL